MAGFVAFSLCASAGYVLNDWIDVEADRCHPRKRLRPFAAGAISLDWASLIAAVLFAVGVAIAQLTLPGVFVQLLLAYCVISLCYSIWLKRIVYLDVIVLAGLYVTRAFAGGVASDLAVNSKLIAASWLFFLSLALSKRHAEQVQQGDRQNTRLRRRGYTPSALPVIAIAGIGCGCLAFFAFLYVVFLESGSHNLHEYQVIQGLSVMLLAGWLGRIWWLAVHRELIDDPLLFALTDPMSLLIAATVGLLPWVSLGRPWTL
jgi:4-hydroxybenzoate polyprenyltransferase